MFVKATYPGSMRRSTRWVVPAGVTAVVVGLTLAPGASADLPSKSPEEVLVMAGESTLDSFSGTVVVRTDLGVPTALLAGDMDGGPPMDENRTIRVWKDGDDLARASVASLMSEMTIIRNRDEVWAYDSDTGIVRTGEVPATDDASSTPPWADEVPDPAEAAAWLLDTIEPTTQVSAGEPTVVAGREAYELVLTPTQEGTLVGSASMAVDAETGAVLRVQVTATGATSPALDVAYSAFDPTPPPAEVFALELPPGASEEPWTAPEAYENEGDKPDGLVVEPVVVGEGWTSVLVMPAEAVASDPLGDAQDDPAGATELSALPADLLTPVDGGAVLTTSLVSVMIADDGRVLVGAVTPDVLVAAAR